ncbi:MAG: DNA alkylation repair protein [Flavobacteriia bacterium]|jgi:3-methyladenine DNA glycosylase AlkD
MLSLEQKKIIELDLLFHTKINRERGLDMSKYMKDLFPFYGIDATNRRLLQAQWYPFLKELTQNDKKHLIKELWVKDEREFQYAAIDLLNKTSLSKINSDDDLLLEWLITNKSWWDSVDAIASNYLGKYVQKFPEEGKKIIAEWRDSENLWLRRSCLIFQLKYSTNVDFELLKSLILQFQHEKEFFIQKAIGWSLRQYSKFNPESVRSFITEINLKGLAHKEASKYL